MGEGVVGDGNVSRNRHAIGGGENRYSETEECLGGVRKSDNNSVRSVD